MSVTAAFVLGLLVGWLVEWVIDWIYWRPKRLAELEAAPADLSERRGTPSERSAALLLQDHTAELDALRAENARLKGQLQAVPTAPDDLKIIRGIGPEIERRLNQAGILSFAQLADLTPADLERILGESIKRLSNEQDLLDQARQLAGQKR